MVNSCLKIGNRLLCGDQLISALVEYKIFDVIIGQVILDESLTAVSLSKQEIFYALVGSGDPPTTEAFPAFLVQWCQDKNVTWEYLNRVLLRDLRVEKFKQLHFARRVESEFLQMKPDLDQVVYSCIQVDDCFLAQELYCQICDDGADFAQIAHQYSLGEEQLTGGWVGPVPLSDLPPEIANVFRSGQTGILYGPIPVDDEFWIVRLERMIAARLTESTRHTLMEQLYRQWIQSQIQALMSQPGAIEFEANSQSLPASSEWSASP